MTEPDLDEEDVSDITILTSSRSPVLAVPEIRAAQRLAELGRSRGWFVRVGVARAAIKPRVFRNGRVGRGAHERHTVSVQMRQAGSGRQVAVVWHWCSDWPATPTGRAPGWRFHHGFYGARQYSLSSIMERIMG